MAEHTLIKREQSIIAHLTALLKDTCREEERISAQWNAAQEHDRRTESELETLNAASQQEFTRIQQQFAEQLAATQARFERSHQSTEDAWRHSQDNIEAVFVTQSSATQRVRQETILETVAVHEAAAARLTNQEDENSRHVAGALAHGEELARAISSFLVGYRLPMQQSEAPRIDEVPKVSDLNWHKAAMAEAESSLLKLMHLKIPNLFRGGNIAGPWLLIAMILAAPAGWLADWQPVSWALYTLGGTVVIGLALTFWLRKIATQQLWEVANPLRQHLAKCEAMVAKAHAAMRTEVQKKRHEAQAEREKGLARATAAFDEAMAKLNRTRDNDLTKTNQHFPKQLERLRREQDFLISQFQQGQAEQLASARQSEEKRRIEIEEQVRQARHDADLRRERAASSLVRSWQEGALEINGLMTGMYSEIRRIFTEFDTDSTKSLNIPSAPPGVLQLGKLQWSAEEQQVAWPRHERFQSGVPKQWQLPALLDFPSAGNVILKTSAAGRETGIRTLQSLVLRLLTSMPPGKVRFVFIDPVGLGENFATFMHLADHDEKLITSRIWAEPAQIERQLADLTAHIENVIQKYLRNEFATIDAYNEFAGEVAEPYRVLVIADFPHQFTDSAARRLQSILLTGRRCGVCVMLLADPARQLPASLRWSDLEANAEVLAWSQGRFQWRNQAFSHLPLELESPPSSEVVQRILQEVGSRSLERSRVEVPFSLIAPPKDKYWTNSSAADLKIPIGRAGATKLQYLELGHGTSQHVVIAGKTGSGKSTFWHSLIVSAALRYSPTELEMYLIDFKKGVEFKSYAEHSLPHARVIAIESEREFGLSVLHRLDRELTRRGELFRSAGVQDLRSYRAAENQTLPRILLIIDEFQEFFTQDDRLAQDASLLLDRLVRQGRAFGIHIHLGSQTLGGAYSLARATLDQMAVRIALQCSEVDAHLILSEGNNAARLLGRPGEAIYNDANGRIEGNSPFQIVWLSESERARQLATISALATDAGYSPAEPAIVFEGHVLASIARNGRLAEQLRTSELLADVNEPTIWLGESVEIKDPTRMVFRRQGGNHLLIIGQNEESALALATCGLWGLASGLIRQPEPGSQDRPRFSLIDGTPTDAPHGTALREIAAMIPQHVAIAGRRDAIRCIEDVAAEVDRRLQSQESTWPCEFLFLYDLGRIRELRKSDDDFEFRRPGSEVPPSERLKFILQEGPAVGIHVIAWCDSLTNLQRVFDRNALRQFSSRVLFQMSATDSSMLIDSPVAGNLGPQRALFVDEEAGKVEKFRPYALPDGEWLTQAAAQLRARSMAQATRT